MDGFVCSCTGFSIKAGDGVSGFGVVGGFGVAAGFDADDGFGVATGFCVAAGFDAVDGFCTAAGFEDPADAASGREDSGEEDFGRADFESAYSGKAYSGSIRLPLLPSAVSVVHSITLIPAFASAVIRTVTVSSRNSGFPCASVPAASVSVSIFADVAAFPPAFTAAAGTPPAEAA